MKNVLKIKGNLRKSVIEILETFKKIFEEF